MEDYFYQILEVSEKATKNEIKNAYDRLIGMNHPDLHDGKMIYTVYLHELNEAYKVLSDPVSRMHYDAGLKIHKEFGFAKSTESDSTWKNSKGKNYFKDHDDTNKPKSRIINPISTLVIGILLIIIYLLFKQGCG